MRQYEVQEIESSPGSDDDQLAARIRGEYLEMPGLHLTARQAGRLLGASEHMCQRVLNTLVDARFLRLTPGGGFVRGSDGAPARRAQR